ncbi:MAG: NADH ubiquinone oxidoreductase 20 kDa subunit [uncultured bacterium]|nr:MAG: NADH ubiquinone oxidoreductase 20 kDa subunit [uncultured bacterium]
MNNKLKIGWFSFTCCEDSTIIFTELLNTHYREWLSKIEFVHARFLRKEKAEIEKMDLAFVEGAISSNIQEEKLKIIRQKAKILIAVGSCAVLGSPSNQRNFFNRENLEEIKPILQKFQYKEKVLKIADIVQVDEQIPGCPMNEEKFLQIMDKYLSNKLSE